MSPEQRQALQAERQELVRKAHKRRGTPGFAGNVEAIEARIAEIDALLTAD